MRVFNGLIVTVAAQDLLGPFVLQSYPLLTLTLPSAILRPAVSQPAAHDLLTSFTKQPLISHTFRPEEKAVNPVLSLAGTAIVLAPWLVLVALVRAFVSFSRRWRPFLGELRSTSRAPLSFFYESFRSGTLASSTPRFPSRTRSS